MMIFMKLIFCLNLILSLCSAQKEEESKVKDIDRDDEYIENEEDFSENYEDYNEEPKDLKDLFDNNKDVEEDVYDEDKDVKDVYDEAKDVQEDDYDEDKEAEHEYDEIKDILDPDQNDDLVDKKVESDQNNKDLDKDIKDLDKDIKDLDKDSKDLDQDKTDLNFDDKDLDKDIKDLDQGDKHHDLEDKQEEYVEYEPNNDIKEIEDILNQDSILNPEKDDSIGEPIDQVRERDHDLLKEKDSHQDLSSKKKLDQGRDHDREEEGRGRDHDSEEEGRGRDRDRSRGRDRDRSRGRDTTTIFIDNNDHQDMFSEVKSKQSCRSLSKKMSSEIACKSSSQCCYGEICDPKEKLCFKKGESKRGEKCIRNADCVKNYKCLNYKCDTLGKINDACEHHRDCRSNMYCSINELVCKKRQKLGGECHFNYHCYNDLCLLPQLKLPSSNRPRQTTKYCAQTNQQLGQVCNPRANHCSSGLTCARTRKRRFMCVKMNSFPKGDSCLASQECRCGEYCSRFRVCQPAFCANRRQCSNYKGLTRRFNCSHGLCMPPQRLWKRAFNVFGDLEGIGSGAGGNPATG